jgi:predicted O-methyltransferase YrrM
MLYSFERALKDAIRPLFLPMVFRRLQAGISTTRSLDAALDAAFDSDYLGVHFTPIQVREEISGFLNLLARRPPATVLEIGSENGGTLFLLARAAAPDAHIISLDLPADRSYPAWRENLYRKFAGGRQHMDIVRADSHAPATLEKVRALLGNRKLDLLFIDGDHSYEGVKMDFEMYSHLVARDGIIAFHDIVDGPETAVGGVPKFWRELKPGRQHLEFVKDWKQGGWGIGVLPPAS